MRTEEFFNREQVSTDTIVIEGYLVRAHAKRFEELIYVGLVRRAIPSAVGAKHDPLTHCLLSSLNIAPPKRGN
jgi:hypothetical protein